MKSETLTTIVDLAKECGCNHATIRKWIKKHHIQIGHVITGNRKPASALSEEHCETFRHYWLATTTTPDNIVTLPDLARECNVDRKTIRLWAERNMLKLAILPNSNGPPTHGLDKQSADKFREEYNEDAVPICHLARRYNTNWRVIRMWAKKNHKPIKRCVGPGRRMVALRKADAKQCEDYLVSIKNTGFFYLIQLIPKHNPNRVKLGFARNVKRRLGEHQTTCPEATLVSTWPCHKDDERKAISHISKGCRALTTEVFECDDYRVILERAEQYFKVPR